MLATFGHLTVAEGPVPWRLVAVLAGAQCAAVWPLARRRYAPVATVGFTLLVQGMLHLVLSCADGDTSMAPQPHATHAGQTAAAFGDDHAWHHAGAAMTTVHIVAALVVSWLLHRADARMTAALETLGTLAKAAVAALACVRPRLLVDPDGALPTLPGGRTGAFAVAARAWEELLEYAVVRRGPPRREHLPPVTGPGSRGAGFSRTSKEFPCVVPLCPSGGSRRPSCRPRRCSRADRHAHPGLAGGRSRGGRG
ncbi:hypothetical protein [Streptomyces sp. LBL]|uniref:hypothetical protein n=1 Tax=Streptomyces sp. LBL TaxID=2940562 RepID=UPI002476E0C3|nr:hypothetical protein [Streptomyces sp. LBL]